MPLPPPPSEPSAAPHPRRPDAHLSEAVPPCRLSEGPPTGAMSERRREAHLSEETPPGQPIETISNGKPPGGAAAHLSDEARTRESPQFPLPPLLLVGCGKMGGALLAGWLEQGLPEAVVVEPNPAAAAVHAGRVTVVPTAADIPAGFRPEAVVLAIKPQEAAAALPAFARYAEAGAVFVSIMAGRPVAGIQAAVGNTAAVVRAMPNTPAAVRQGFTVSFAGPGVTEPQRTLADRLLAAVGEVAWVTDEAAIDPVTAVSGGGPAYVFLLAELLEAAAIEQGLNPDLARRMARATVAGSGALLAGSAEDSATLRRAVTSPKGTTERALAVLMAAEAWPALLSRAIAAATERSRELAG